MKMKTAFLAAWILSNVFMPASLFAEEAAPADAAAPVEEMEYSFGEVKSISSSQLVLLEYDYLTDKESDVTYAVDPAVALENAKSLDEIKTGDSVEIDYLTQGDTKLVKTIILEKEEEIFAGAADDLGVEEEAVGNTAATQEPAAQ